MGVQRGPISSRNASGVAHEADFLLDFVPEELFIGNEAGIFNCESWEGLTSARA
jgi:hypothetical protein